MKTQTLLKLFVLAVCPQLAAGEGPVVEKFSAETPAVNSRSMFHEPLSPESLWNVARHTPNGYDPSGGDLVTIVRGQTPTFDNGTGTSPYYDGSIYQPTNPGTMPYQAPMTTTQPMMVDPFMNPQSLQQTQLGVNGPQPFRYGWTLRTELQYLADEVVAGPGATGNLGIWGIDIEAENVSPLAGGWVFSHTPEFGWRGIEGPATVNAAGNGLPGSVFHLGWDLKWQTPSMGGWSAEFAFDPSFNSDFSNTGGNAWNFDGRAGLFWQWDPTFTLVGGVMYWDRVQDRVLPYGGIIWLPNQLWEFRIMYPETQLKFFLGNFFGESKWFYARAEYHSEAYAVELDGGLGPIDSQVEFEDWRVAIGLQSDNGYSSSFIEAGWVFDRTTRLKGVNTFDVDSGFMARAGFRF